MTDTTIHVPKDAAPAITIRDFGDFIAVMARFELADRVDSEVSMFVTREQLQALRAAFAEAPIKDHRTR